MLGFPPCVQASVTEQRRPLVVDRHAPRRLLVGLRADLVAQLTQPGRDAGKLLAALGLEHGLAVARQPRWLEAVHARAQQEAVGRDAEEEARAVPTLALPGPEPEVEV